MGYFVAGGVPPNLGFGMTSAAPPTRQFSPQKPRKAALTLIFQDMGLLHYSPFCLTGV